MTVAEQQCLRITLTGEVQGVGMRPFLYRIANRLRVGGWVKNVPQGVVCQIQANEKTIQAFLQQLDNKLPRAAKIEHRQIDYLPCQELNNEEFQILASGQADEPPALALNIPPDLALCSDCTKEILDPKNRRFGYPFTSCTQCGPRWSIARSPIYDRINTAMADFPLCEACQNEYDDSSSRRFHHQANACPQCGPQLQLLSPDGNTIATKQNALPKTIDAIRAGKIVALQGIGGFQLIVDANNPRAVDDLRRRKTGPINH